MRSQFRPMYSHSCNMLRNRSARRFLVCFANASTRWLLIKSIVYLQLSKRGRRWRYQYLPCYNPFKPHTFYFHLAFQLTFPSFYPPDHRRCRCRVGTAGEEEDEVGQVTRSWIRTSVKPCLPCTAKMPNLQLFKGIIQELSIFHYPIRNCILNTPTHQLLNVHSTIQELSVLWMFETDKWRHTSAVGSSSPSSSSSSSSSYSSSSTSTLGITAAVCWTVVQQVKGIDQFWEIAPLSTNEMVALITNHVKEYVLTSTWWYKFCRETAY